MDKKVAILQSNYIPWKGYFDLISVVVEFIFYDEMQYTRNDWRNRNKIKGPNGLHWLTIGVKHLSLSQKIRDTEIADVNWNKKHYSTIKQFYSKSPFFKTYQSFFEELYLKCSSKFLSEINYHFITSMNDLIGIKCKISWSSDYKLIGDKTERLVNLCRQAGASEYISGPSAKGYIQKEFFELSKIKLTWMDYSEYPEYHQLYPPFEHEVSIIDLIFNEGPNARNFMKY